MRIGIYICHCEGNISDVIDIEELLDFSNSLDSVVLSKDHESMCSDEAQKMIFSDIEENNLDKIVIAACSPHFHENTFRKNLQKSAVNQHEMEIVNIREQGSWVHYDNPKAATEKAKAMVAGAVEKVKEKEPLEPISVSLGERVMVVGGGIGGVQASLDLADAGFRVILVEKEPTIGGKMAQLSRTFPTNDCAPCILDPKLSDVAKHPKIDLYTYSEIEKINGSIGNYEVEVREKRRFVDSNKCTACGKCAESCPIEVPDEFDYGLANRAAIYIPRSGSVPQSYVLDEENCVGCGECRQVCPVEDCITVPSEDSTSEDRKTNFGVDAIIVATGYGLYDLSKLSEYNYESNENIIHAGQIERMIIGTGPTQGKILRPSDDEPPESIAFVLCAGSRDEKHCEYCSQICCMYSMKEAFLARKKLGEDTKISIFYTDIRAAGKQFEEYYNDVQEQEIEFIKGKPTEIRSASNNDNLIVRATDTVLNEVIEEEFDLVVLAPAIVPNEDSEPIASMLNLPKSPDGFFKEKHPKYKPVDTRVSGVFLAGCAQGPKDIPRTVEQSSAAAARTIRLINQDSIEIDPQIIEVDKKRCNGCGNCVDACPFDALFLEDGIVRVEEKLCQGCGLCVSSCPENALSIRNYGKDQIIPQIKASLSEASKPRIIAFLDDTCSYEAADTLSNRRIIYPSKIIPIRVPDGVMVDASLILETLKMGADAVYLGTCEEGANPYSQKCASVAQKNVETARKKIRKHDIEKERVKMGLHVTGGPEALLNDFKEIAELVEEKKEIPEQKLENLGGI